MLLYEHVLAHTHTHTHTLNNVSTCAIAVGVSAGDGRGQRRRPAAAADPDRGLRCRGGGRGVVGRGNGAIESVWGTCECNCDQRCPTMCRYSSTKNILK